jgi:hypothetical protein
MIVYIVGKSIEIASAIASQLEEEHPTQLELLQWLSSQSAGFTYAFPESFKSRWDDFSRWIDESPLNAIIERSETHLTITLT